MDSHHKNNQAPTGDGNSSCTGNCRTCRIAGQFHAADGEPAGATGPILTGWPLAVAAVATFLVPLVAAIVGASISPAGVWQLFGALVGLVIALPVALIINLAMRRIARRRRDADQSPPAPAWKERS